jgi:hypothetical protein
MAITNAAGPNASRYFKHLENFLLKVPDNIMDLSWFQLKSIVESELPEQFKESKVTRLKCFLRFNILV